MGASPRGGGSPLERRFEGSSFVDPKLEERVGTLGRRVVQYATIEPDPYSFESDHNVGARGE